MPIEIIQFKPAESPKMLNTEWFILKNASDKTFTTRNCVVEVSRKGSKKSSSLGTMDPGFSMAPGESVRVVTGNPGRKAHGSAPEDEIRNYNLFLGSTVLKGDGTIVTIRLRQMSLATAEYSSSAETGVAPPTTEPS
jgi:hypothetical protein